MGTTFKLQRVYSEEERKEKTQGMGLGTKLALGGVAAAGAFYGAKRGLMGNQAGAWANKKWAGLGNSFGSNSMMANGARNYGKFKGEMNWDKFAKHNKLGEGVTSHNITNAKTGEVTTMTKDAMQQQAQNSLIRNLKRVKSPSNLENEIKHVSDNIRFDNELAVNKANEVINLANK